MKLLNSPLLTLLLFAGFCWLAYWSQHRPVTSVSELIDRSLAEAEEHHRQQAAANAEDDAHPLYLTAQDAANAAEDWNTMYASCESNPACRQAKLKGGAR